MVLSLTIVVVVVWHYFQDSCGKNKLCLDINDHLQNFYYQKNNKRQISEYDK
jgi:hypothetical protein